MEDAVVLTERHYKRLAEHVYCIHKSVQTASLPEGSEEVLFDKGVGKVGGVEQLLPKVLLLSVLTLVKRQEKI